MSGCIIIFPCWFLSLYYSVIHANITSCITGPPQNHFSFDHLLRILSFVSNTNLFRRSMDLNFGDMGTGLPEFVVGYRNANCTPPDFVMFHNFKHQNTPFQAKNSFLRVEGVAPSQTPSSVGRALPSHTPPPLTPSKSSGSALHPPEFQPYSRLCP